MQSGGHEFDDFVKAATPSQSTTATSTNGTPAMTTKDNSSNHFFDDFSDLGNASQSSTAAPEEKKTMSKDSIMALFNVASGLLATAFMEDYVSFTILRFITGIGQL